MPLKFEANLMNQLGNQLPTPVIEKVEIYTNRLSITVSIYIEINEDLTPLRFGAVDVLNNQYLKGLKLYCFYVLGENDTQDLIKKRNYKIFNEITTAEMQMCAREGTAAAFSTAGIDLYDESENTTDTSIVSTLGPLIEEYNNYWDATADINTFFLRIRYPNYFLIDIENMTQSDEEFYSEKGHPIVQYTTTQNIDIGFVDSELNLGHGSESIFPAISSALDEMTIFAFSSPLVLASDVLNNSQIGWDPNSNSLWQAKWDLEYTHTPGFTKYKAALNPVLNKTLYVNEFSDVAYEKVFKRPGLLNNEGQDVYVTTSGDVFNGTPIRSTKGGYYGDAAIRLQTIEEDFRDFNNSHKASASNNPKLQAAVDSVSYVLESKKEDSNLLYELNQYRKAFPQKTGSGVLANYYKRFRGLIVDSDKRVRQGGILSAKKIRNTKLIDFRGHGPPGYVLPEAPIYNRVSDFLYWKNALVSHTLYYDARLDRSAPWKGQIHGYFFFDLQKAFRTQSAIAQVLDYDKLVSIFGEDIMRRYYYIRWVHNDWYLDRSGAGFPDPAAWDDLDITAFWKFSDLTTYMRQPSDGDRYEFRVDSTMFDPIDWDAEAPGFEGGFASPGDIIDIKHQLDIGETENTYLLPRSFDLPSISPLLNRYNLVCFEFQNLYEFSYTDQQSLENILDNQYAFKAEIICHDKTPDLYEALADSYKILFEGDFTDYYNYAVEACNFNSLTQKFNTFFSEAMTSLYSAHSIKPWAEMALAFYLHQDLIHNTFNGDELAIQESATLTSEQINPETGLLPALRAFYEKVQEFYMTFYNSSSELSVKINDFAASPNHHFGPGPIGPVPYPVVAEIEEGGTIAARGDLQVPKLGWTQAESSYDMWEQDLASTAEDKWQINNLSYYQGWSDNATAFTMDPRTMSLDEWRTQVRSAMADLQNVRMKAQKFHPNFSDANSAYGRQNYKPLYKDIRSYIKTLAIQTFVHFNLKDRSDDINQIDINAYLATHDIQQILHQTNPRIVTSTQPGLMDIMTSTNYNALQIYNPAVRSGTVSSNIVGIESETATLQEDLYPTPFKETYSFIGVGESVAADSSTSPFVYNAYRRLMVLAFGWFYYETNKFLPEWSNNPMDFIFENGWEIPIWADGDPAAREYPSSDWISTAQPNWPNAPGT
jgi:hypothetical protein